MVDGATMTTIATIAVLALLSTPNFAFTPTVTHRFLHSAVSVGLKPPASRNFGLSAKDTIFSVNDDDDDDEEIDAVDSDDIEDIVKSLMVEENAEAAADTTSTKKKIGDPLREDNGVRPSIHPTTINAIAEALKARATQSLKPEFSDEDDMMHFSVSDDVEPLMVMVTAGQFASDAIQKRQESSTEDGMLLTQGEEQTLAGRIMGVIMRLDDLEDELVERTEGVGWVGDYNEWGSFGVLENESEDNLKQVHAKILDDPLFCMNRAECLLAIFLQNVEIPQLERLNETVPDGSIIDFLDEDRKEVVLGSD